jgi:hypothetical protein
MRHKICGALLAVAMLAGLSGPATADFIIGTPNVALSPYPGPYVSVDVTLNAAGTEATITATSLSNGSFTYLMGDGSSFGLNTNGAVSVGVITGTPATHGAYSLSSGNVSSFGNFNFIIDTFDGFTSTSNSISFTLTLLSGTWANEDDVFTANNKGFFGEAHIFVASPDCTNAAGAPAACVTGFAGNGEGPPPQETPEPGILSLLGMGLLAAGATRLRRRKA